MSSSKPNLGPGPGGVMCEDIKLLTSNLFPKLSLVTAVGLRALGFNVVLALSVIVGIRRVVVLNVVVVVVVLVEVDVVVVEEVVEVVVVYCAKGILIGKLNKGYWVEYFFLVTGVVDFVLDGR